MSPGDEADVEPGTRSDPLDPALRETARRRLTYVMVLAGVVFVFAVLVAIYMFWVAGTIVS